MPHPELRIIKRTNTNSTFHLNGMPLVLTRHGDESFGHGVQGVGIRAQGTETEGRKQDSKGFILCHKYETSNFRTLIPEP